jgi:Uma2 family endonuclease
MPLVNASPQQATYSHLVSWPDDGRRYELYDGEVYVVPAPMPRHQIALIEIHQCVYRYAQRNGGLVLVAPIDIVFDELNVLQPDIALFSAARRHHVQLDSAIRVPPDLVVEVLSPSTARHDLGRKKETFARFGVPEYWVVDPHLERIERHTLVDGRYALTYAAGRDESFESAALAGFRCDVDSLFPW